MTAAALLAAVASLLLLAGVRELVAGREGGASILGWLGDDARRRSAAAALKLGLPGRLRRAGLEGRMPMPALLLAKLAGAAVGGIAALVAAPAAPGRTSILIAVAVPAAGFLIPDALLEREARRRRRRLVGALPDALDVLAVSAASGRSSSAGLAELGQSSDGPLGGELRVTAAGSACGQPLSSALGSLRSRVAGSEVAALCAAIERSRRFGSPLADQLRRQATSLRRDQRRTVEESAARAAPKIQLVIALILVPSVLLMIAAGLIANVDRLLAGY